MSKPITIVQGGQFGSEAKGAIAGWLATERDYDYAVRTGAINAGHTVYYKGKPYVNQQLPVAWVNPETQLVIGAGAYVHIPTLEREISMIAQATGVDPAPRILIDNRASVHLDSYADESKAVDRHHRIGATGKGCAEAIVHKIVDRGVKNLILSKWHPFSSGIRFVDTATILSHAYRRGTRIMLEGTQGELLDFHLGEWPYVTSRQTTPAAWVAEAGLSPRLDYEVVLVVRTFPIRVAGNSGRLPLETTWPVLARKINYRLDLMGIPNHPLRVSEEALVAFEDQVRALGIETGVHLTTHHTWTDVERERRCGILSDYAGIVMDRLSWSHQAELRRLFEFTTVTKKLRRVAFADVNTIQETVFRVDPSWVAITFLNYEFPEIHGRTDVPAYARRWADSICPRVEVATTGPMTEHVVTL